MGLGKPLFCKTNIINDSYSQTHISNAPWFVSEIEIRFEFGKVLKEKEDRENKLFI